MRHALKLLFAATALMFATGQQQCQEPEDIDGDGYTEAQGDCDDSDPTVNPDGIEVCDGRDNNCDGFSDEGVSDTYYEDQDGDAWGNSDVSNQFCDPQPGYVEVPGDCDDQDDTINPSAVEDCDGLDNDCDGSIDEEVAETFYIDLDADGFGDSSQSMTACDTPTGYAPIGGDCDDVLESTYPGAPELCDSNDNDCDSVIDEDNACQ